MNSLPTNPARRVSAASLTVPKRPTNTEPLPAASAAIHLKEEAPRLIERLRRFIEELGPKANKHDLVTAMIYMCIGKGLNTDKQIIGTIYRLGFNNRHVAMMLKEGTGRTSVSGHWRRNADKTYTLLT